MQCRALLPGERTSCVCAQSLNHVQLFMTLWTAACQAPLSTGFSRQGYCSGLPFPPPGNLPNPGIEPMSPVSPALAGEFFTTEPPGWRSQASLNRCEKYLGMERS